MQKPCRSRRPRRELQQGSARSGLFLPFNRGPVRLGADLRHMEDTTAGRGPRLLMLGREVYLGNRCADLIGMQRRVEQLLHTYLPMLPAYLWG